MRTIRSNRRTGAGVLAVMAASALSVGTFGLPASAAGADPEPTESATPLQGLPTQSTGNLHITKAETPGSGEADGTQKPGVVGSIKDVTFSVQKVEGIDLSTNAGWQAAADLAASYNSTGSLGSATLGNAATGTTAADGTVDLANLPIGLYYVQETATPAGVVKGDPFLVTLPMTNPTALNEWMYDVYVYPKNSVVDLVKSVADADDYVVNDDLVEWTILADIPKNENGEIDAYKIVDDLDAKLDYVSITVSLTEGTISLDPADYTVLPAAATDAGPEVSVTFTASGLEKLEDAAAAGDQQVQVVISTEVNASGVIPNTATLYPNQWSVDNDKGEVSNEVDTKWGGVLLEKVDAATSATKLAGAEFQVFTSAEDAAAQTNPVSINGVSTFTTASGSGQVVIDGLRYSDYENGATDATPRTYWLVETKAPSGYELLADPVEFQVTAAATAVGGDAQVVVENVEHNAGFTLPLTGGSGTALLTGAGVVVLAAALVLVARSRRQTDEV